MKKLFSLLICALFFAFILDEKILNNNLYDIYKTYYKKTDYSIVTNLDALKTSEYFYEDYSTFVKNTSNFSPKNKDELLNIYYSILNNGWKNFSYYCDSSYMNCLNDIEELSKDSATFTNINQLVHPYNSFKKIKSTYSSDDRIDISITRKYSDEEILKIDNKINEIINELNINDYTDVEEKIKVFHDYIANTNKYDVNKESGASTYRSDTALGTLFEGYSICSGYTDTMAIFLSKIGLENIKVASNNHTWNAVKINDEWKHIDLTWDDPITDTGEDIITYDYFLIDSNTLNEKNNEEHKYSEVIYNFLK